MKILVTGSQGSLAKIVMPYFEKMGNQVFGVDKHNCDLRLPWKMEVDAVFHTAALVYGVVGFHKNPGDIIVENSLITANLLKYTKFDRFVYISSSMVYEKCPSPHREDDVEKYPIMSTSYGLSKYIGERMVKAHCEQNHLKYTIWRPFNIITPFEDTKEVGYSHVFTDFIDKILVKKQQPLEILGDGNQVRCFTSIHDVAEAMARFSFDTSTLNQTINLANLEPITMKQLAKIIVEVGMPEDYKLQFKHLPSYPDDVKKRIPNVDILRDMFGWEAKIKVRESIEEICKKKLLL